MKKIFVFLIFVLVSVSLYAENYNYSISPYLGYHYFGDDRDKEDNTELGLKVERFLQKDLSFEVGLGYIPTEKDESGDDIDLFTYQTHLKYYLGDYRGIEPFVSGGLGGDLSYGMNIGPSVALGAKYNIKDNMGLFAEIRDNYLFGNGNDVIVTAGMNFYIDEKSETILDSDGDGIKDNVDKCPDTLKGVNVNSDGCPYDSDNDGVYDYMDKCPETPAGVKTNEKGCPLDFDNDGVYNHLDKCPETPTGVNVNSIGCPLDSDKDGVYDYMDKCQNTLENVSVDNQGCPLDTDNDGVYDYLDNCPNSPSGSKVDSNGCEISISLKVYFNTDKADVKQKFYGEIEKVAKFMKKYPDIKVEIAGHADSRGSREYNLDLSQRRASAVVEVLVNQFGISNDRVETKKYGYGKPIASNDTAEGRQKNRRVEAVIIK